MISAALQGQSRPSRSRTRPRLEVSTAIGAALCMLVLAAGHATASTADESVVVHGTGTSAAVDADDAGAFDPSELEALVAPIALYPDDLLAVVLPASTYPLQIVQAARYLEALEDDASLEPDVDWDQSVIALLNYPEVVAKLNEDLDWTADLGEAVMTQEEALLDAVDRLRRRAHTAGNLTTDGRQRVEVTRSAIAIRPADPGVIYVPYYEPRLAFHRHHRRVIHYYPRPCPVYYYPYPAGHYLASRHFWGTTSAFSIAWHTRNLHFHLLEHQSHPYYGYDYAFRHYRYWEPRLYHRTFYRDHPKHRFHDGNRWRRHHDRDVRSRRFKADGGKDQLPFTRPPAGTHLRGNRAAVNPEQVGLPSREEAVARAARRASSLGRQQAPAPTPARPDAARRDIQRLRRQAEAEARVETQTRIIRRAESRERRLQSVPGAGARAPARAYSTPSRQAAGPEARMRLERATPRIRPQAPSAPAPRAASPNRASAAEARSARAAARGKSMRAQGPRHNPQ